MYGPESMQINVLKSTARMTNKVVVTNEVTRLVDST